MIKRVNLDPSSSHLHSAICNPDSEGICRYKPEVKLPGKLSCDGFECTLESVRVVNVSNIFYEYVEPACAELAFYQNPVRIARFHLGEAMCADPKMLLQVKHAVNPVAEDKGSTTLQLSW